MEKFSNLISTCDEFNIDELYFDVGRLNYINVMLICGLPGVGKTFFCEKIKKLIKLEKDNEVEIFIFNFDEFLFEEDINEDKLSESNKKLELCESNTELKDETIYRTNKLNFDFSIFNAKRKQFLEHFNNKINDLLSIDKNNDKKNIFLLDDNFYFKSMRKPFYKICEFINTKNDNLYCPITSYLEVHLKASQEYYISLNSTRKGRECIPEDIIRKMEKHFEWEPVHKDLNYTLEINSQNILGYDKNISKIIKEIINKLNQSIGIQLENIQIKRNIKQENKKHNKAILIDHIEIEMRKKVKETIQKKKHLAKNINDGKKLFMNLIKSILNKTKIDSIMQGMKSFELYFNINKLKENEYNINEITNTYIKNIIDLFEFN